LGRTVAELETGLGSGELTEWKAYYHIEPFGQERDNWHAATIATVIANYSGKLRTPLHLDEFMLEPASVKKDRETKRTLAMMSAMAKKNG